MRWDSPFVLATAGTFAIHLLLIVATDAVQVYNPPRPSRPAPRIELFEVEVPPEIKPPPPPVAEPAPEPEPPAPAPTPQIARTAVKTSPIKAASEPLPTTDTPPVATDTPTGGDQVVVLDSAPDGTGRVPVAIGRRTSDKVGRGGGGKGTGAGSGSGATPEAPPPVSVATIKKRALPKGDQSYFDAGKDYPPEARQLSVEGIIKVRLVVGPDGKVVSAVLVNKLGHGLDELALSRSKLIEFTPALDTNDQPVSSVVVWTFTMTLPK